MNTISFQKTLLGLGVAIALGVGTAACGSPTNDRTATSDTRAQGENARSGVADSAVTANVKTRLTSDASVRGADIQVRTNNGVVTLEGTVASDYVKSAAETIARSVEGVDRVDSRLVASSGASGTTGSAMGSDRMGGDRMSADRMGTDRMGADGTRADGTRSDAMGSEGTGSDTWITAKVKSQLMADSVGRGLEISVDTKDGIVTLEGALDSEDTIEHVSELAADVEGVRRVDTERLVVATRN